MDKADGLTPFSDQLLVVMTAEVAVTFYVAAILFTVVTGIQVHKHDIYHRLKIWNPSGDGIFGVEVFALGSFSLLQVGGISMAAMVLDYHLTSFYHFVGWTYAFVILGFCLGNSCAEVLAWRMVRRES